MRQTPTGIELVPINCLECPVCGEDYHHIAKVGTELDPDWGDEAKIIPGTSLVFERNTRERHSALRVDFEGECGHNWVLILQQHKGQIFISTRLSSSPSPYF
jgi:hypothetical protein